MVIGAGIVGASIAFHLARRRSRVTVIDGDEQGTGASGHSFAWLNSFDKNPASYHELNRRSIDIWDRFARRLQTDVGLHWGGGLRWESTPEGGARLRQHVVQLQAMGYPCRAIDETQMRELEPELSPGTVAAAAYSDIEGRVDPSKVVRVCLHRASALGAVVRAATLATGLRLGPNRRGSQVQAVLTTEGEIACDVAVLAAGTGSTELAATAGIDVPQEESPGVVVRTDARPPVLRTVSVLYGPPLDAEHAEIHVGQSADGTLMIGEGTQESLARDDSREHADDLLSRAMQYLPALAGARAIPVPVGYRPMPVDGLPVVGFSRAVPNLYIALMHSGVTLAPLVGELSAIEIVDGARVASLDDYRVERFETG